MTLPVVYRQRVQHDLAGAFDWYELQGLGTGDHFLAVQTALHAIGQYPEMFAAVHGEVRRAIVSRFPLAVFYTIEPQRVVVLRVLHTSRNPALWPAPRGPAR